ncbi:MAG: putative Ig domain-containing protein [Bdellovibrionales bacterium]|nr:putative Ig domain-containing protein [Bdellovibrionales bacterium]
MGNLGLYQFKRGILAASALAVLTACGSFNNPIRGSSSAITISSETLTAPIYSPFTGPIPSIPSNKIGEPTTYSITPALPSGLFLIASTGQILGTPFVNSALAEYELTAKFGPITVTKTISIEVTGTTGAPTSLDYNSGTYPFNLARGQSYNFSPSVTGGTPSTYDLLAGTLPAGLTLNSSTGVISGTPTTLNTPGGVTITVNARNPVGSALRTFNIYVAQAAPVISSYTIQNATGGSVYQRGTAISTNSPTIADPVNGPADSFAIVPVAAAPAFASLGLTFDTVNGQITGNPSVATPTSGGYQYDITATNAGGTSAAYRITVAIKDPPITAFSYPGWQTAEPVGMPISPNLTASVTGGGATNTFSVTGGPPTFPLSLNTSTGEISGTPGSMQAATNYTFCATNWGMAVPVCTSALSLEVQDGPPATVSYTDRSGGTSLIHGSTYSLMPTVTGGAPTSWSITGNSGAPAVTTYGLAFNTTTGEVSGTVNAVTSPTVNCYTVTGTNGWGSASDTNFCLETRAVAPTLLSYTNNGPVTYTVGNAISNTVNSTAPQLGGPGNVFAIQSGGPLPAGMNAYNTTNGDISGTPTALRWPASNLVLQVTNSSGTVVTRTISMAVQDRAPGAFTYTPSASYNRYYAFTLAHAGHSAPTSLSTLTYSISPSSPTSLATLTAAGISLNTTNGTISAVAGGATAAASYNIIVRATPASASGVFTDSNTFTVNIVNSAADLAFVTTGQTPNPQVNPTNFGTSATNVVMTFAIRNRAANSTGPLTITLDRTGGTESTFYTITGGTCVTLGSCSNTGTGMTCPGPALAYSGPGTAYSPTCTVQVTGNFASVGITSGTKTANLTVTPTTGTAATYGVTGVTAYTWTAVPGYAASGSFNTTVVPSGACSVQSATTLYKFADAPAGTQEQLSKNAANDAICSGSPDGTNYYQRMGFIRQCGTSTPTYAGSTTGSTCRNCTGPGEPGCLASLWTNWNTGSPQFDDTECDTSRIYVVQVYRCQ